MKRVLKVALLGMLAFGLLMGVAACGGGGGGGGGGNSIVGVWTAVDSVDPDNIGGVFVFNADGTGVIVIVPMTYTYTGSTVTLTAMGQSEAFAVTWINSNKMTLTSLVDGGWATFVRN